MYSTSIASHLLLLALLAHQHTSNATMFHICYTLSSCLPEYQCISVHTLHSVQPCPAPVVLLLTALVPFCICFPNSFHNYITLSLSLLLHKRVLSCGILCSVAQFWAPAPHESSNGAQYELVFYQRELWAQLWSRQLPPRKRRYMRTSVQLSLFRTGHLQRRTCTPYTRQNNEGQDTKNKTAVNVAIHMPVHVCKYLLIYKRPGVVYTYNIRIRSYERYFYTLLHSLSSFTFCCLQHMNVWNCEQSSEYKPSSGMTSLCKL